MRKILLPFILLLLTTFSSIGQITLEKDYNGSVLFAYLESNAYYSANYTSNQVAIYGLDYSLKKYINLTPPANMYLYDVAFVSKHVFNDDDLFELIAVYYNYTPTSDTGGYYYYTTQVVNENGTVLLDIPDGSYSDLIAYNDGSVKLMAYIYDFSISLYVLNTQIYSLPGTLASSTLENSEISLKNPYPNPASNYINIPYRLDNESPAELILVDISGQEINRVDLPSSSENIMLNTGNLKPGNYIYYMEISGRRILSRKFIKK